METIAEYLRFLSGAEASEELVYWPPDAFACAASLLERSGAYIFVVTEEWPPLSRCPDGNWAQYISELGRGWRTAAINNDRPPSKIRGAWATVLRAGHRQVAELTRRELRAVRVALLEILASADEACADVGAPKREPDAFDRICVDRLSQIAAQDGRSTLCKKIPASKSCVLPKMHTPQSGITIRSLSRHLALCGPGDAKPRWFQDGCHDHGATPYLTLSGIHPIKP